MARVGPPGQSTPGVAIYPSLIAFAFVLNAYTTSNVSLEALWRPVIVALVATLAVQAVLSLVLRSASRGAAVTLVIQMILMGLALLLALGAALAVVAWYVAQRRGVSLREAVRTRTTPILNVIAVLLSVQVLVTAAASGSLTFAGAPLSTPRGVAAADAPDIYLILLDGYPRADTLESMFDYDDTPFLESMESMGFDVARQAHSNYDATVLTLASMFNGQQIPELLAGVPATGDRATGYRAVSKAINAAADLRHLREAGYEIVSIPSGYSEATLLGADRIVDGGQLSTFEDELLRAPGLAALAGGIERAWVPDQQRSRLEGNFAALPQLAAERGRGPKVVFDHILAPHMPVVFTKDGDPVAPLQCFPADCSLFDFGDRYGETTLSLFRGQVEWLNGSVTRAVKDIQSSSARPPVIVVFSDHGSRMNADDHDEMFRSLLLASTPGHDGLFPDDATPVNLLNRLVNAYTPQRVPLASEEAYWIDVRQVDIQGTLDLLPWQIAPDD